MKDLTPSRDKAVTTGMIGDGFYNENSAPQMAAIEHILPWLEDAARDLPLGDSEAAVGLADFGCSEGRNSIAVMQRLVPAVRAVTTRPIRTIHSDLPTNDFSRLFVGLRAEGRSVFPGEQVYSVAVGGSMFEQLLPARSVHMAMTFNAIGFLGKRPLECLPAYILPNGPSEIRGVGSVSSQEKAVFAAQAGTDLEAFLRARATELIAGGKVLIQVFGAGETLRTCDGIYDVFNDAVLGSLAAGLIDRPSYEAFYQPVYFRTLDELTAGVADAGSPLSMLFRLDQAEAYEAQVPFVEAYAQTGDIERYARKYTDFFRAFTEPVVRSQFADHPALDTLITDIYERAEKLLRDHPMRYPFRYIAVAALMTRLDQSLATRAGT